MSLPKRRRLCLVHGSEEGGEQMSTVGSAQASYVPAAIPPFTISSRKSAIYWVEIKQIEPLCARCVTNFGELRKKKKKALSPTPCFAPAFLLLHRRGDRPITARRRRSPPETPAMPYQSGDRSRRPLVSLRSAGILSFLPFVISFAA